MSRKILKKLRSALCLPPTARGFTLVEIIVYIGIVVGMLGTAFVVMNNILIAQERNTINSEVFDNASFIARKIMWALDNVSTISQPASNSTSTTLSVTKASSTENPFVFDLSEGVVRLTTASGSPVALSNSRVVVDDLSFQHVTPVIGSDSIRLTLVVHSAAQTGLTSYTASTTLSTTMFLAY